jgi:hypothetical protein
MPGNRVPFVMESSCRSNWCWAAVAVGVANSLNAPPGPFPRCAQQCSVANIVLAPFRGSTDCCSDSTGLCDRSAPLEPALIAVHHCGGTTAPEPAAAGYIEQQLSSGGPANRGRPIPIRIQWTDTGNGGHFITITGFENEGQGLFLFTDDPYYGPGEYSYDQLANGGYRYHQGSWSHTYTTA